MRSVLFFTAPWCAACKTLKSELDKQELGTQIFEVDVSQNPELANQFCVQSLPTVMCVENHQPLWQLSGGVTVAKIKQNLENYL